MPRDGARDENEFVLSQQVISKLLLPCPRDAGMKPVRIGNGGDIHDVNIRWIGDRQRRENVRDRIEHMEGLMDSNLKDGSRRIYRAIDCPMNTLSVPPTARPERSLATIPGRGMFLVIEAPGNKLSPAQCTGERDHT